MKNEYYLPTKIIFGIGSLEKLKENVDKFQPKKILLVTGKTAMNRLGITNKIINMLKDYKIILYDKVIPNPSIETVEEGLSLSKKEKIELVIGLGGGSPLDVAKSIAILMRNEGRLIDYLLRRLEIKNEAVPFIAIPTTSGTASEVTMYAAITNNFIKNKMVLTHKYMYPDVAILDPGLTLDLDKKNTAYTGLDALSHAIESYWSINSFEESDKHALRSIELVNKYLEKVYNNPGDIKYREKMMLASLEAGKAFSQTGTTAVHSVSFPMTVFYNIPHGFACALTLADFLKYNYNLTKKDCLDKRGPEFVKEKINNIAETFGKDTTEEAAERIQEIMKNMDLPARLSDAGIKDIDIIIKYGFTPEKLKNNPRLVTENSLKELLLKIF